MNYDVEITAWFQTCPDVPGPHGHDPQLNIRVKPMGGGCAAIDKVFSRDAVERCENFPHYFGVVWEGIRKEFTDYFEKQIEEQIKSDEFRSLGHLGRELHIIDLMTQKRPERKATPTAEEYAAHLVNLMNSPHPPTKAQLTAMISQRDKAVVVEAGQRVTERSENDGQ